MKKIVLFFFCLLLVLSISLIKPHKSYAANSCDWKWTNEDGATAPLFKMKTNIAGDGTAKISLELTVPHDADYEIKWSGCEGYFFTCNGQGNATSSNKIVKYEFNWND